MRKNHQTLKWVVIVIVIMGCTTIAPFSQRAYEQTTSLKVDALILMDKATEPFFNHKQAIQILKINIEKAYEYAKGRQKNEITTNQWAIIKDPARNSLAGFLKRWENKNQLDKIFIQESKELVSAGFDAIIELESGKIKPSQDSK